jgi:xanthine dehydrogenase/oxidase
MVPIRIPELNSITEYVGGLDIGASVTLSRLEDVCRRRISSMDECGTRILREIVEMLRWFAGKQIRNVAAVGGNIMTGSPISDLNQVFVWSCTKSNCFDKVESFL